MYFTPRQGSQFGKFRGAHKLLNLGEAHYGDDRSGATEFWLDKHIFRKPLPFWSGIENIIYGEALNDEERERF